MNIIQIVYKNNKLKAQLVGTKKFVKFPKHLREDGKLFLVDNVINQGKYYSISGDIKELSISNILNNKGLEKPPVWYVIVEYDGIPGWDGEPDNTIEHLGKKYNLECTGSGYGGARDMSFQFKGTEVELKEIVKLFKNDLKKVKYKPKVAEYYLLDKEDW